MAPPTRIRVPSLALLRAFLKPPPPPCIQTRSNTNWMPREKYHKLTALDKLHRRQKAAIRQEKIDSQLRAKGMLPPSFVTPSSAPSHMASPIRSQPPQPPATDPSTNRTPLTLPYTISRTRTSNLPIYEHTKSGGSKHITLVRRISGDLSALSQHLQEALQLPQKYIDKQGRKKENVTINQLTKQIVVRGWRGAEVKRWCETVGF